MGTEDETVGLRRLGRARLIEAATVAGKPDEGLAAGDGDDQLSDA